MNFLVESNIAFNGLNKLIFEYLNFRPFLEELLDKTSDIRDHIKKELKLDISYDPCAVVKKEKWIISYYGNDRVHLYDILNERNNSLKIKDNYENFRYRNGLNLCYIYY